MDGDTIRPTILVVDDTPANIDLVKEIFSQSYTVKAAINGKVALKVIAKKKPDLILLDIMMPEIDGYEVCRRIKADKAARHIPIIFLTAKNDAEDETKGFRLGAVDYLTKPFNPEVMKARVKTHLSLKRAREELERRNIELREAARLREDVERISRHDLKNPLNAIIGCAMVLRTDDALSQQQREEIGQNICTASWQMLEMINRSLDIFKMERGIYILQSAKVDLHKLINNVIRGIRSLGRNDKITFTVLGDAQLDDGHEPVVQGEELLLHSMLSNLVTNAIEASPQNEAVNITLHKKNPVEISITNHGVVPESIRGQFFDKYVTHGKSRGTGLGTYSAKLIAHAHGGSIDMRTSVENGTTLTVCLPVFV